MTTTNKAGTVAVTATLPPGEYYGGLNFADIPKNLPLLPSIKGSKVPYKGVQHFGPGKYRTKIEIQGRQIPLGAFATAEEAAQVYARAEYFKQRLKDTGGSLPDSVKGAFKKRKAGPGPGAGPQVSPTVLATNPNATHIKPKKPVTAYNFFFKEQREKIIKLLNGKEVEDNDPGSDDYIFPESIERLRREDGNIKYVEIARLIGERWKTISQGSLIKYNRLAAVDLKRYTEEMKNYVPPPEGAKPAATTFGAQPAAGRSCPLLNANSLFTYRNPSLLGHV